MNKPCKFGARQTFRNKLKKFYKKQRRSDAVVGLQKTELFRQFFEERKYLKEKGEAPDKESIEFLGQLAKKIKEISEVRRFRDDFPSFSKCLKFFKEENLSLKDLEQ